MTVQAVQRDKGASLNSRTQLSWMRHSPHLVRVVELQQYVLVARVLGRVLGTVSAISSGSRVQGDPPALPASTGCNLLMYPAQTDRLCGCDCGPADCCGTTKFAELGLSLFS